MKPLNDLHDEFVLKYKNTWAIVTDHCTGEVFCGLLTEDLTELFVSDCVDLQGKCLTPGVRKLDYGYFSFVKWVPEPGYYNTKGSCIHISRKGGETQWKAGFSTKWNKISVYSENGDTTINKHMVASIIKQNYYSYHTAAVVMHKTDRSAIAISKDIALVKNLKGVFVEYNQHLLGFIAPPNNTMYIPEKHGPFIPLIEKEGIKCVNYEAKS